MITLVQNNSFKSKAHHIITPASNTASSKSRQQSATPCMQITLSEVSPPAVATSGTLRWCLYHFLAARRQPSDPTAAVGGQHVTSVVELTGHAGCTRTQDPPPFVSRHHPECQK